MLMLGDELVAGEVAYQLAFEDSFSDFANHRRQRDRSIVSGDQFAAFLVQRRDIRLKPLTRQTPSREREEHFGIFVGVVLGFFWIFHQNSKIDFTSVLLFCFVLFCFSLLLFLLFKIYICMCLCAPYTCAA